MEADLNAIQLQNQEQMEALYGDGQMVQDGMVNLAYDVEDARRRLEFNRSR